MVGKLQKATTQANSFDTICFSVGDLGMFSKYSQKQKKQKLPHGHLGWFPAALSVWSHPALSLQSHS